jgi:Kef-type K+ transport system membrane component KefB
LFSLFVIFFGGAVLATVALFLRQALPIAYIVLGVIAGSHGLGLVTDTVLLEHIASIGILFLLFLLGLDLSPNELIHLFKQTAIVTIIIAVMLTLISFGIVYSLGMSARESLIIGMALSFSSSIIGLKLLPTTTLHHQHVGKMMISILLLQDLIAILFLVILEFSGGEGGIVNILTVTLGLPLLIAAAILLDRYLLLPLVQRFDKIREYIFVLTIGWCLGISELAYLMGLSHEMGAFIAGVAMATSPIAQYIAEALRPLRDFFLIVFFFALGAGLNLLAIPPLIIPVAVLAVVLLFAKPLLYRWSLQWVGEEKHIAKNVGVRLGQSSEFGLLIAILALKLNLISEDASMIIQLVVIVTFVVSTYYVVMNYPSPVAVSDELRRD